MSSGNTRCLPSVGAVPEEEHNRSNSNGLYALHTVGGMKDAAKEALDD
jgi:hypothetical protein